MYRPLIDRIPVLPVSWWGGGVSATTAPRSQPPSGHTPLATHPLPCEQTDACENITFPVLLRNAVGKNELQSHSGVTIVFTDGSIISVVAELSQY